MNNLQEFYTGIGKRKTSLAKIFLTEGSGNIKINNKEFKDYFSGINSEYELITIPLILLNLYNKYDLTLIVKGGGISGQFEAIRLALSKALCKINAIYRPILKKKNFLRSDSRIKERRKYGLKKARKASQYSKR
jgi:small subunit ribosomal protein S9